MPARLRRRLRYLATSGLRRRIRDHFLRAGARDVLELREDLARRYLAGDGIEIGPMAFPLRTPPGARVRYVDHQSRDELVRAHETTCRQSGLDPAAIPEVDVVDDAGRLARFDDGSVDFVVANHVLEHLEDPIAALQNLLRVIRPGGILFLTLPDARRTFDARRSRTTVEHLLRDHREGASVSRNGHYEEWARINEGLPDDRVAERVAQFTRERARNHFHVWELGDFLELLHAVELPGALELAQMNGHEFAIVLRRT